MNSEGISMIQGLPSSVMGWLVGGMVAGWLARRGFTWFFMDLNGFSSIYMDLHDLAGIAVIQGLGCPAACGALWQKSVAPIQYHAESLGLAGWQAGRLAGWLDGWMEGSLDGWMAGWWASQL